MPSQSSDLASNIQSNFHRNILLFFDESISINQITTNSIIFVLVILFLYILGLFWACQKDKEKSAFAPNLEGKNLEIPRSTQNLQQIELDYTAETLDMTSVTTEEMRQYSNTFNGLSSSPNRTPTGEIDRTRSFQFEIQTSSNKNTVTPQITISDDTIFQSSKQETEKKSTRKKQTIKSKFKKLIWQRHLLCSTYSRMSKIFPRTKRVTLIFFLFSIDLFTSTWAFIDQGVTFNKMKYFFLSVFLGWGAFALISRLSAVSKDDLKIAHSNEDFQRALHQLEREGNIKSVCLYSIVLIFSIFTFLQYSIFLSILPNAELNWLMTSLLVFLGQIILIDLTWLYIVALFYVKAYDSKFIRKIYRIINSMRFWKIQ